MIVKAKGGSKQIHLSEEEITLDQLKECSHILYMPNVPIEERAIVVSFTPDQTSEVNKLYKELQDPIKYQLTHICNIRKGDSSWDEFFKKVDEANYQATGISEFYIPSVGRLIIKNNGQRRPRRSQQKVG